MIIKSIINEIKHWFWWRFKATEKDKAFRQFISFGTVLIKNGKVINNKKIPNK